MTIVLESRLVSWTLNNTFFNQYFKEEINHSEEKNVYTSYKKQKANQKGNYIKQIVLLLLTLNRIWAIC